MNALRIRVKKLRAGGFLPGVLKKSGNANGGNHQAAIIQRIFTGGQANQFITVHRGDTGVIERKALAGGDKIVKFLLIGSDFKFVIAEALAQIGAGFKHREDFVYMILFCRIKENQGIVVPGLLIDIIMQAGKHASVLHIVTVKRYIIAGLKNIALFPDINTAPGAVLLIKIPVEIIVGIVYR